MIRQDRAPSVHGKWSLGDRAHRPYRPPQLLTGHVDDFPLIPVTPVDIAPRPILPPPSRSDGRAPEATVSGAREINRDPERPSGTEGPSLPAPSAEEPAAAGPAQPSRPPQLPKPVQQTTDIVVQPDPPRKRARIEPEPAVDYSEMGVEKLRKVYDWIGRVLSNRGVPPPEPQFPSTSRHRTNLSGRKSAQRTGRAARSGATKSSLDA